MTFLLFYSLVIYLMVERKIITLLTRFSVYIEELFKIIIIKSRGQKARTV